MLYICYMLEEKKCSPWGTSALKCFRVKPPGSHMGHGKDKHVEIFPTGKPSGQFSNGHWSPFWWHTSILDSVWPRGICHLSLFHRPPNKSSPRLLIQLPSCSGIFPSLHHPPLLPKFRFLPPFYLVHSISLSDFPDSSLAPHPTLH